jgi:hypothetical protein
LTDCPQRRLGRDILDLIDLAAMWAGYQATHDAAPGSGRAA